MRAGRYTLRILGREVATLQFEAPPAPPAEPCPEPELPAPGSTHHFGFGPGSRPARDYWGEVQA